MPSANLLSLAKVPGSTPDPLQIMSHIQLQAGCDHIILLGDLIMVEEENDFAVEAVDGRRCRLGDEVFPWIES